MDSLGDLIPATDADAKVFPKGMCGRTPLWYYLLREAAIEFNPEPQIRPGKQLQKLGTMGSQIVAETLHQLLNADSDSIVHAGCGWKPPVFKFGPAGDEFSIRSLPELARFTVKATIDQANRGTRRPRNKTVGYH